MTTPSGRKVTVPERRIMPIIVATTSWQANRLIIDRSDQFLSSFTNLYQVRKMWKTGIQIYERRYNIISNDNKKTKKMPTSMLYFENSVICRFWPDKIGNSKYIWLNWFYLYLWIGSGLSTNIWMIERNVPIFYNVIIMVICMILTTINIKFVHFAWIDYWNALHISTC